MESKESGLGEVWQATEDALLKTIPVYNRGNRIISFGRDLGYRREGIIRTIRKGDRVLDLGCGPGTMSRILLDNVKEVNDLVLADPLKPMLNAANNSLKSDSVSMVSGIFERLPFQDETFDVVMCGFSFRDAQNYYAAVREISRVLKHDGGRFLIVDLGKPNGRLQRWLVGLYLRFIAGFLAFLILGRQGLVFSRIYPTYRKYPRINQLRSILNEEFEHVTIDTKMMGGAIISLAEKRNR